VSNEFSRAHALDLYDRPNRHSTISQQTTQVSRGLLSQTYTAQGQTQDFEKDYVLVPRMRRDPVQSTRWRFEGKAPYRTKVSGGAGDDGIAKSVSFREGVHGYLSNRDRL